jgi:exodeoxyribonuclease-3
MIGYYTIVFFCYFDRLTLFFSTFEIINLYKMKIISYNVNGIRAAISKGFIEWLKQVNPDVVCLQEIKASEQLPLLISN